MNFIVDAVYDGKAFLPIHPLSIPPDTHVRLSVMAEDEKHLSFLEVAESLNLDGPPDWSLNIDEYLYGGKMPDER
jgi:hypothetical protein